MSQNATKASTAQFTRCFRPDFEQVFELDMEDVEGQHFQRVNTGVPPLKWHRLIAAEDAIRHPQPR